MTAPANLALLCQERIPSGGGWTVECGAETTLINEYGAARCAAHGGTTPALLDLGEESPKPALGRNAPAAVIIDDTALLQALHGEQGKFDALRKATWCQIAVRIRDEAYANGRKITEAEIEQRAHAHPDYVAFLARSVSEHAQWAMLPDVKSAPIDAAYAADAGAAS
jgi:hypothetical protein